MLAGAEHPRELRPQGDGLQQRALHPHAVSGDEPRLCRPRLLLRRSRLPAAMSRCAGCCRRTTRSNARSRSTWNATTRSCARRPLSSSRVGRPILSRRFWKRGAVPQASAATQPTATQDTIRPTGLSCHCKVLIRTPRLNRPMKTLTRVLRGNDIGRGRGRGRLGGVGHAERRLGSGGHRGQARASASASARRASSLDAAEDPFNVIEPGKRPRVTLDADARAQRRQAVSLSSPCRAATVRIRTSCSSS